MSFSAFGAVCFLHCLLTGQTINSYSIRSVSLYMAQPLGQSQIYWHLEGVFYLLSVLNKIFSMVVRNKNVVSFIYPWKIVLESTYNLRNLKFNSDSVFFFFYVGVLFKEDSYIKKIFDNCHWMITSYIIGILASYDDCIKGLDYHFYTYFVWFSYFRLNQ